MRKVKLELEVNCATEFAQEFFVGAFKILEKSINLYKSERFPKNEVISTLKEIYPSKDDSFEYGDTVIITKGKYKGAIGEYDNDVDNKKISVLNAENDNFPFDIITNRSNCRKLMETYTI